MHHLHILMRPRLPTTALQCRSVNCLLRDLKWELADFARVDRLDTATKGETVLRYLILKILATIGVLWQTIRERLGQLSGLGSDAVDVYCGRRGVEAGSVPKHDDVV